MRSFGTILKLAVIISVFYLIGCAESRNQNAVERLHDQLKLGAFEQIYEECDQMVKSNMTRDELVEFMKEASTQMRNIDSNFIWHRTSEKEIDRFWDGFESFSSSYMERDGKKHLRIEVAWRSSFKLCGFSYGPIGENSGKSFRYCD